MAILLLGYRVNEKPFSDNGYLLFSMMVTCVVFPVAAGVWSIRRQARDLLPRKRRLEALLKELDAS